ncbi:MULTISPECIES: hypothetical protein [unclassified Thiocapsa]|uniref:NrdR family transcriptional regulator n=1 Tax=unclassified Thiocapsa TaxID=2641286 RepID=UPI0035AE19AF
MCVQCPVCSAEDTAVLETRRPGPDSIKRRRACLRCRFRFSTVETITRTPALATAAHLVRQPGPSRESDPVC